MGTGPVEQGAPLLLLDLAAQDFFELLAHFLAAAIDVGIVAELVGEAQNAPEPVPSTFQPLQVNPELITDVCGRRHRVQDGAHLRWAVSFLGRLAGGLRAQVFQQGWLHLRAACFLPVSDGGSDRCFLGRVGGCRFQLGLKRVH